MNLLEAALASAVAAFGPDSEPRQAPPGFGVDLDGAEDLDPMMGLVGELKLLAQAMYRRLSTPRGMLLNAPDYGFDLRSLLHKGQTPTERAAIPGLVRAEVLKDERIESVDVEVTTYTHDRIGLMLRCQTAAGPFRMTLDVTAAAVVLAEVR